MIKQPSIKKLIEQMDSNGLRLLLTERPELANEDITIPFDFYCRVKAHPLHRLCDAVFAGKMIEEEAIVLAEILLEHGAHIDGDKQSGGGTPLQAAASLHAELLGVFYIEKGADVNYTYPEDGASALHWAAFCGREKLVDKLLQSNAIIDEPDTEHQSTPLGWAIHCLMSEDKANRHNQPVCIQLLLNAGANIEKLDKEKQVFLQTLLSLEE